jgi:[protein-PII] uridylyltransferase
MDWGSSQADPAADVPLTFVEAFSASMPSSYRVLFDPRAVRRHAAVAYRRGERQAYAEVWKPLPDASAALCVIAQDRPGLLSAIAAALVSHRLDVITALVFSRTLPGGEHEAVDFLWVRRASKDDVASIGAEEAVSVSEVLNAIVSGSISAGEIASRALVPRPAGEQRVAVRFDDSDDDGLAVLLVEAPDRPGVLLTIALEVFQQGAQIVRSLVRTADGRAFNRFELVEFSGATLSPERRDQIRAAVYAALALNEPP